MENLKETVFLFLPRFLLAVFILLVAIIIANKAKGVKKAVKKRIKDLLLINFLSDIVKGGLIFILTLQRMDLSG